MFECCPLSFFPSWKSCIKSIQAKIKSDFREAKEPVKCNFIQIFPQKRSSKKHKTKF